MKIIESAKYLKEIRTVAEQIPKMACTVLVTGATGMIGSCIVDTILCSDKELGNKIKVAVVGKNKDKLKQRFDYANPNMIFYIFQDIMQPLTSSFFFDYIIHMASKADPISYALYPVETLLTNLYGTNNVLEYCRNNKTRVLFTSTFEAYGRIPGRYEYKEEDSGEIDLNSIRSCYPESKRCAEILMKCYHQEYNVDCVIARLSSIYGPTMAENDSKAHAQFIRNALARKNIVLKSEGLQKRTYCYLMDAVSGLLTVLFKGKGGEAYNISNEKSVTSIADLAKTVADLSHVKVVFDQPSNIERSGFSRSHDCVLANEKLRNLGWTGKYSLKEGLRSTLEILQEINL